MRFTITGGVYGMLSAIFVATKWSGVLFLAFFFAGMVADAMIRVMRKGESL